MRTGMKIMAPVLMLVSGILMAAPLSVGPATKSTLTATFRQEGVPVEAPFTRFSGQIEYDARNPAAAGATIEVDMSSLDIGDPAYNDEVAKKSWFDSKTYPKAVFKSTSTRALAANRFEATGQLTLKGHAVPLTVPVTASATAAGTAFDGSFQISRKAFGIGDPTWESVLEDKVTVKFHLVGGR